MIINGREFEVLISREDIRNRVVRMAREINRDYSDKNPLFLVILKGAFIFAADFIREVRIPSEIAFMRLGSYEGMHSTGKVKSWMDPEEDPEGRHVIILEDIVDTGRTLSHLLKSFEHLGAHSIEIATLLFKDLPVERDFIPRYIGFRIPDRFVVGYGLDYDGTGRNLKDIYQIT